MLLKSIVALGLLSLSGVEARGRKTATLFQCNLDIPTKPYCCETEAATIGPNGGDSSCVPAGSNSAGNYARCSGGAAGTIGRCCEAVILGTGLCHTPSRTT